jgi:hypothetical protein
MAEKDVHYYYIRDEENRPVITVAIADLAQEGVICRGIAICSKKDQPVKARGRAIAFGRLMKAYINCESSDRVLTDHRLPFVVYEYGIDCGFKSGYNVEATDFELSLLDRDFDKDYNGPVGDEGEDEWDWDCQDWD